MIARLVAWCGRHHWLVIAGALALAVGGDLGRRHLSRDVIPDLADPQIGVVVDWMGHPAPEVEAKVARVLTEALGGVRGAKAVRGSTMTGMAYVDLLFDAGVNLDTARAEIAARVAEARPALPPNVRTYVGPAASTTGWVFEYALTDPARVSALLDLRQFQDDVLRPAIAAIPGVAEVASVGGDLREVRIDVKPRELRERGLAFTDVRDTLAPLFAADHGLAHVSPAELEALPVQSAAPGNPVRLGDVALVRLTEDLQTGLADLNGQRAVGGIVIARRDADLTALVAAVKQTIARECRKLPHRAADPARLDSGLAADIHVATTYDRSELATRVRATLLRALAEEIGVVVLVISRVPASLRAARWCRWSPCRSSSC